MKKNSQDKSLQSGITSRLKRLLVTCCIAILPTMAIIAQDIQVSGTVVDQTDSPLIGVSVAVKNTTNGTTTDLDGKFSLNVNVGNTLEISYIGFKSYETVIGSNKNLGEIRLDEDTKLLDEVVVVGYGTMEKRQVTSSISSIKGDNLVTGLGGSSIATALQGKISGLVITGNASPNSSNTFQLRGVASVNSSQSPLIVIDGIPGGDMRSIIQEDIQSIDVLKDASAGAIYGTRAAGGVILITTKQAKTGKTRVNYTSEFSMESIRKRPEVLSAQDFVANGLGDDLGHDTNWYDEVTNKNPISHRHVINVTGGTEAARIYTTFTYADQKGVAIGDSRKDYSGRINANFTMFDGILELKTNVNYREAQRDQRQNGGIFNQALKLNPTETPYDNKNITGYNVFTGGWEYYNPVADVNLREYMGKDKWTLADAVAKINFTKDFYGQATLGYQGLQWQQYDYTSANHKESIDEKRRGKAYHNFSKDDHITFETFLNYSKTFNKVHTIGATGGYSFLEMNGEGFNMTNYDFPVDGVGVWDMNTGTWLSDGKAGMDSNKKPRERLIAFFGRFNYSYDDRYMITASIRHEGSSKFGKNNKWGDFWSVSGGWRLSSEEFMKDFNWLDELKLRVGYGVTGNNGFAAGKSTKMYGSDTWWLVNGKWNTTYGSKHNVNNNLKWEEKAELNLGLDYGFFNNRLFGKLDIYKRKVNGMIYDMSVPVPPAVHDKTTMNAGNLENKGWEFEIGGTIVQNKEFNYTTTMRFSQNTSKITSLAGSNTFDDRKGFPGPGSPGTAVRLVEGGEIGKFYIWRHAGFDEDGKWLLYDKDNNVIPAKDKKNSDKAFVGNAMPKMMIAMDHSFAYKDFDLTIYMRSWLNFDVYNTMDMYYGIPNVKGQNVLKDAYDRNKHITGEKELSDYFLEDGSFLKIDAINVGYTLNLRKYTKYLDRSRFYLTIRDIATFTKYKGMNPEVNISGLEPGFEMFNGLYPQTIRWTLGVQLSF